MLKILVLFQLFCSILCRTLTNASYVTNNLEIHKRYPVVSRTAVTLTSLKHCFLSFAQALEYNKASTDIQGKSYYSGYGTALTPAYYSTFDPLSVFASLAFLAFLLQSFASLFDRSRSITPATVTARQFMELKMLALTTQVLRALEKYEENRNGRLIASTKHKIV